MAEEAKAKAARAVAATPATKRKPAAKAKTSRPGPKGASKGGPKGGGSGRSGSPVPKLPLVKA